MSPPAARVDDMRWRWDAAAHAWIRPCGPVEVCWAWCPHTPGEWEMGSCISARLTSPVSVSVHAVQQAAVLARFRLPALGVRIAVCARSRPACLLPPC